MNKHVSKSRRTSIVCTAALILFILPAAGFGFNMVDLNSLYLTKQCPKCDLTYGKLPGFVAPRASLVQVHGRGLNLQDATLDHSDLSGADLTEAKLMGASLKNAKLQKTNLKGANLVIVDLSGADLSNANLTDANLKGANLSGANIEGADLSGAMWPDWGRCGQGSIGECKK
ncbi:MAG TPA: hypothetical protein DCR97_14845 [Deltaproteobacteria bacterium]|nr:hypothetical protein [Deltaproteobacteria bacterium]